jgi:hypothetical protein
MLPPTEAADMIRVLKHDFGLFFRAKGDAIGRHAQCAFNILFCQHNNANVMALNQAQRTRPALRHSVLFRG